MGINLKHGSKNYKSWWEIVQKNRQDDKERVEKHGGIPRFPAGETFTPSGKIKTSKQAETLIAKRSLQRNEKGQLIPITARGRRRAQRLAQSK